MEDIRFIDIHATKGNALDNLHPLHGESLGPVLQDGGFPKE